MDDEIGGRGTFDRAFTVRLPYFGNSFDRDRKFITGRARLSPPRSRSRATPVFTRAGIERAQRGYISRSLVTSADRNGTSKTITAAARAARKERETLAANYYFLVPLTGVGGGGRGGGVIKRNARAQSGDLIPTLRSTV